MMSFLFVFFFFGFHFQTTSSDQAGYLIERVASDFNQLQFYVTQCQGHPLVEKIRSVSIMICKDHPIITMHRDFRENHLDK